jgi:hypothetical protein
MPIGRHLDRGALRAGTIGRAAVARDGGGERPSRWNARRKMKMGKTWPRIGFWPLGLLAVVAWGDPGQARSDELDWVRVSDDWRGFVYAGSGRSNWKASTLLKACPQGQSPRRGPQRRLAAWRTGGILADRRRRRSDVRDRVAHRPLERQRDLASQDGGAIPVWIAPRGRGPVAAIRHSVAPTSGAADRVGSRTGSIPEGQVARPL